MIKSNIIKNIIKIVTLVIIVTLIYQLSIKNNMNNENKEVLKKIEHENGLVIEILSAGAEEVAEKGKTVAVHYTGKLEDGTIFDSSIERGVPIEFTLGAGMVIQGWEQGILNMRVGEKRILTIPPELAYGTTGAGPIPGGATLIFEVELMSVN